MGTLPIGTVTFVFTDIARSTRLLHEQGAEAYAAALAEHPDAPPYRRGIRGRGGHLGARIAAAGHGGQVLLSKQTREAIDGDREPSDLGEHRLKDFGAPVTPRMGGGGLILAPACLNCRPEASRSSSSFREQTPAR